MVFKGFWDKLKSPIIGLSPMDGITDDAFRYITCKYSKPSLVMTEFNNVEGLARGATSMLKHFQYDKSERPIVAQIYGVESESFYKVTLMVCYLGFDGVDINMGCPASKIAKRGSGAGLIKIPKQAQKIIQTVKKATEDWKNGIKLEEADIRPKIITALKKMRSKQGPRKLLPVSVKTRIGYEDKSEAEEWVKQLLTESPAAITMHGRTFRQMYSGVADWEVLSKCAKLCKEFNVLFLGNGDVRSFQDAKDKIKKYRVDGVLVGRATNGNPWFFSDYMPNIVDQFDVAIEHAKVFEKIQMKHAFFTMRKHLAWYCKGFDGARELRNELMQASNSEDVEKMIDNFKKT